MSTVTVTVELLGAARQGRCDYCGVERPLMYHVAGGGLDALACAECGVATAAEIPLPLTFWARRLPPGRFAWRTPRGAVATRDGRWRLDGLFLDPVPAGSWGALWCGAFVPPPPEEEGTGPDASRDAILYWVRTED